MMLRRSKSHTPDTKATAWRRWSFRRRLTLSVMAVGIFASLAITGSWAAWTVTDSNTANTFSTTTVLLDDNQGGEGGTTTASGTAMFNVTNLSPGSAATTECIGVNVANGTPTNMTLTAALGGAGAATLGPQLTMNVSKYIAGSVTVTPGTNTNSGSCASYPTGTSTTFGTQGGTLTSWAAASPYTVSTATGAWYEFTVSGLPAGDTACATYCNQTVTLSLTWTLTSN